jgi:hypothetical protein
MSRLIGIIYK